MLKQTFFFVQKDFLKTQQYEKVTKAFNDAIPTAGDLMTPKMELRKQRVTISLWSTLTGQSFEDHYLTFCVCPSTWRFHIWCVELFFNILCMESRDSTQLVSYSTHPLKLEKNFSSPSSHKWIISSYMSLNKKFKDMGCPWTQNLCPWTQVVSPWTKVYRNRVGGSGDSSHLKSDTFQNTGAELHIKVSDVHNVSSKTAT